MMRTCQDNRAISKSPHVTNLLRTVIKGRWKTFLTRFFSFDVSTCCTEGTVIECWSETVHIKVKVFHLLQSAFATNQMMLHSIDTEHLNLRTPLQLDWKLIGTDTLHWAQDEWETHYEQFAYTLVDASLGADGKQ